MPYKDPERQRAAQRRHYETNHVQYKALARAHDARVEAAIRSAIIQYLQDHPCIDCGEADLIVLEFDHRDRATKSFNVSEYANGGYSLERVMAEIDKCDVRCANCHRRKTYKEGGFYRRGVLTP